MESMDPLRSQMAEQQKKLSAQAEQLATLQKENRQLKKTVYAYQLWSKTPGVPSNAPPPATATAEYQVTSLLQVLFAAMPVLQQSV